jgi:heme A synthase
VSGPGRANRTRRFTVYAWSVLGFNFLVILWGAVVRATGSGAGCGEHWPLCQGVVIPHAAQIATLIEFAHRATSGIAVALVLGLLFLAFHRFVSGHPVRRYAAAAVFFTFTEGLIGAALVLWGQVGNNASMTRVLVLSLHLVNTFLLLASLALCASSAAKIAASERDGTLGGCSKLRTWYAWGLLGVITVAVTGTIAALGDTLFPAASVAQGLHSDFSGSANALLRLRIIHPVVAAAVGIYLLTLAVRALRFEEVDTPVNGGGHARSAMGRHLARSLFVLVLIQFVLGPLNLLLLTPLWAQILHLLAADLLWVTLVLLADEALGYSHAPSTVKLHNDVYERSHAEP